MRVAGSPGTTRIASPEPASVGGDRGNLTAQAKPGLNAPGYILPSLYIAAPTPQIVRSFSTNEIPLPAIDATGATAPASASQAKKRKVAVPKIAQRSRRIGGGKVQPWPRVSPIWPVLGGGGG